MLTLAIETSYKTTTVALAANGLVLGHENWSQQKSSSEVITQLLQKCMLSAGSNWEDLNCIAVTTGPGSFTGIRVGINVARTLAYALDIPIVAVTSPWLIAQMIPENNKPLMVLVDAFRNLIYCDQFTWQRNEWVSRGEIQALKPDEILSSLSSPTLVAGPGLEGMSKTQLDLLSQRATRLPPLDLTMSAQHLAIFASRQQKPLSRIEWRELKPLYIRDSEAEEKLKAGFLKPLGIQNKWVDS